MKPKKSALQKTSSRPATRAKRNIRRFFHATFFTCVAPICISLWLAFFASPVIAKASDINLAVQTYKRGHELFYQKRYNDALSYFLEARQHLPESSRYDRARTEFLYYTGLCYFHLQQDAKAEVLLMRYMASRHRKLDKLNEVQRALAAIRARKPKDRTHPTPPIDRPDAQPERQTPQRLRDPVDPPQKQTSPHVAGWIILGVGVAALIGGVIAGALARDQMDKVETFYRDLKATNRLHAAEVSEPFREAQSRSIAANTLYIAGGSIALTGAVLLFVWKAPAR